MRAFGRPGLDEDRWWADLEPLLTAQAQQDYAWVDPRNVPVSTLTGPPRVVPTASSARVSIVHVPTDDGLYAVTLVRSPAEPQWRAQRITPPEPDPHSPNEDPATGGGVKRERRA